LYDYAYEKVKFATPKQTPSKFSTKQQGEITLRQSTRIEDIKPVSLPAELMDEIEDTRPYVREAAVQKLDKIVKGRNIGLARSAKEALEKIIADENTTRRVAQAATQVLESIQQAEQSAIKKEAEEQNLSVEEETKRIALRKAEVQRLSNERAVEAERQEKEKAERYATRRVEEERITKAKLEAERLAAQKDEEEHKVKQAKMDGEHSMAQSNLQQQLIANKVPFFISWRGRILLGAMLGLLFGVANTIFFSIYYENYYHYLSELLLDTLAFAFICGLAGLIIYPHKLSLVAIVFGFLAAGIAGYEIAKANTISSYLPFNFLAFGTFLGVPAGALISRILYKLKIIR